MPSAIVGAHGILGDFYPTVDLLDRNGHSKNGRMSGCVIDRESHPRLRRLPLGKSHVMVGLDFCLRLITRSVPKAWFTSHL